MSLQALLVGVIVALCALQAAWTLMPARVRSAVSVALLKLPLPWPAFVSRRLSKAASGAGAGCGGGCEACGSVKPDAIPVKPIVFHRASGSVSAAREKAMAHRGPPSP